MKRTASDFTAEELSRQGGLADGNRIVHKSTTLLARDSTGRTRQETKSDHGSVVYIYDPVEQRGYVLRPASKSALIVPRVAHMHRPPTPPAPPAAPTPPAPPAPPAAPAPPKGPDPAAVSVQPGRVVVRSGKSGAGAIGNEKPIAIVSERWFSPDLNVVVMSRNLDPRSGETVYRLTNVRRGEPSADLFKVPADYKLRGDERTERKR